MVGFACMEKDKLELKRHLLWKTSDRRDQKRTLVTNEDDGEVLVGVAITLLKPRIQVLEGLTAASPIHNSLNHMLR